MTKRCKHEIVRVLMGAQLIPVWATPDNHLPTRRAVDRLVAVIQCPAEPWPVLPVKPWKATFSLTELELWLQAQRDADWKLCHKKEKC